MLAKFVCRVVLHSLSGVVALLLGWPGSIGSLVCGWVAITSIWTLLEFAALKRRCHSVPFLLRLFLSYAVTILITCCILMSNLEAPDDVNVSKVDGTTSINTISIVLPCANESFVQRTVESILEATPKNELLEIIVVDDASSPPVTLFALRTVRLHQEQLRIRK